MTCPPVLPLLLLCALIATPVFRLTAGVPEEESPPPLRLGIATVTAEPVVLSDTVPGRVAASRRVEIRPQVGGLILERPAEGGRVAAGDVLFRLDPAPLSAELASAEAILARALAARDQARRALGRSETLLARDVTSAEKTEAARSDLALAEASLAEAQASVERRRLDLQQATLKAPITGHVAAGVAEIGTLAVPGADRPLAVVQDLDRVHIDLRLPATQLAAIRAAAAAGLGDVEILGDDAQPHPARGRLDFADTVIDPGTGTVTLRVTVANPGLALLPGQYVRARLPRGVLPAAVLVPEEAVLRDSAGGAQIVVVSGGSRAERRPVTLGERLGGRVIVAAGLHPGETVAVLGQDRVAEGPAVAVTTTPAPIR
ncbi:efflux RND transporter periplasmic adaptor subunit [Rhodobacter capsulatus]|uniref:efflux RND transporter periplasmic adaptor subunit n=1 Tax=Rhodobacter capsulatus TaxID=1061 RepID=UPI001144B8F5|nr:efflux RND transporter periplasmic adaptor subunit [Rhodobacter capsulatus]TQD32173.1 efflux RND transporter periplasmic adaptor subunit [Rhodobacter capsulatus]